MDLHHSITLDDVLENMKEAERSFKGAEIANTKANTDKMVTWLGANAQHPEGGILPTVQVLKTCFAELHRRGEIEWMPGKAPKTQEDHRREEEAKKHAEMLTPGEVRRQSEDSMKAAVIMSGVRKRANTAAGDVRSYVLKAKIRDGLTAFLNDFVRKNDVKKLTAAQADAFETTFNAEETRLFGGR